jgi:hypothetical protein
METVSECELQLNEQGEWVAIVGNSIDIEALNNPSGVVGI